jgi:hypothetical protein
MTALLASFVERHLEAVMWVMIYVWAGASVLFWLWPDGDVDE